LKKKILPGKSLDFLEREAIHLLPIPADLFLSGTQLDFVTSYQNCPPSKAIVIVILWIAWSRVRQLTETRIDQLWCDWVTSTPQGTQCSRPKKKNAKREALTRLKGDCVFLKCFHFLVKKNSTTTERISDIYQKIIKKNIAPSTNNDLFFVSTFKKTNKNGFYNILFTEYIFRPMTAGSTTLSRKHI